MRNVVILLCFNDDEVSVEYLKRIVSYQIIHKIVVVDNGSNPNKRNNLKRRIDEINSSKIIFIENEINAGYAVGNNIGINYAINNLNPDTIVVSNTDVIYTESSMEECLKFLYSSDDIGIISPRMLNPQGEMSLSAWKLPSFCQLLWNSSFALKKLYNPQAYTKLNEPFSEVDVLPGSLLIAKSAVWKAVNGFDEDTFLYGEESLLAYKVKEHGFKNYLLNNCSYVHNHSTIINQNIKSYFKKMKLLYEANCVYNRKCLRTNTVQNIIYFVLFYLNTGIMSLYQYIRKIFHK